MTITLWNVFFLAAAAINLGFMPLAIAVRDWRWLGVCLIGLLSSAAAIST